MFEDLAVTSEALLNQLPPSCPEIRKQFQSLLKTLVEVMHSYEIDFNSEFMISLSDFGKE